MLSLCAYLLCFLGNLFLVLLQVNVCGQFNASRLAAKVMAENEPTEDGSRGVIILTSGFAAKTSRKGHVGIGACYGGIESMTLPMSRDLGSLGIRVATISPGISQIFVCTFFCSDFNLTGLPLFQVYSLHP